jgi:hypothetical protein
VGEEEGRRGERQGDDGAIAPMGAEMPAAAAVLRACLPRPAAITVRRDGAPIKQVQSTTLDLDIAEPGAYRLEARIDGRLWLLSNPIHLR